MGWKVFSAGLGLLVIASWPAAVAGEAMDPKEHVAAMSQSDAGPLKTLASGLEPVAQRHLKMARNLNASLKKKIGTEPDGVSAVVLSARFPGLAPTWAAAFLPGAPPFLCCVALASMEAFPLVEPGW